MTIQGPIVLVAHSYGGFVITNAAVGVPSVKALVYIDAFIPDEGDTLRVIRADRQEFMSERANATIERVGAGHLSLISRPEAVTNLIRTAVAATS